MNKKNKNKNFFFVPAGTPSTNRYTQNPPVHPVHSQYARYLNQYETLAFQNRYSTYRPVPVQYTPASTGTILTTLIGTTDRTYSFSHPTKASCVFFLASTIIFISPPFWTSILTCCKSFELPLLTVHSQGKINKKKY